MTKKLITLSITVLILCSSVPQSQAEESFFDWLFTLESRKEVKPETDTTYNEECGDCHFPYQPGLLPEASWQKLLKAEALEDHFGENAELDDEDRQHILNVLVANSADKSRYKRSKKIMVSLSEDKAPLRIIEVPYIRRKHHEVYEDVVKKSDKVKSLSFCDKCHEKAKEGNFDDDTVVIPGYGNWTW